MKSVPGFAKNGDSVAEGQELKNNLINVIGKEFTCGFRYFTCIFGG